VKFSKCGEWKVSECGFYRIKIIGKTRSRGSLYQLHVRLDDGWVEYPDAFRLLRDAKDAAARLEE
jgi:hypothetical protein